MKRIISLLLILLMAAAALPALAAGATIQCALPSEIQQFFSASAFDGCTVGADAYVAIENTVGGSYAFAVAQKGGHNVLYGFERQNGQWVYWLRADNCLPQGNGMFMLSHASGAIEFASSGTHTYGDVLDVTFFKEGDMEQADTCLMFEVNKNGQWNVRAVLFNYVWDEAIITSDSISYWLDEGSRRGVAYGVVETNMRYFSLSAFPRTIKEAQDKLSNPPAIPSGTLNAERIKFTGGQKFEVYSGPGREYVRGAGGKASVSTNDWIQVFGSENGYIMIQYNINSTQMRIGYIDQSALPRSASVSPLRFEFQEATVTSATFLTDDPLNSKAALTSLSAGQSGVYWLATMGNWVYVEVTGHGQPVRGFVPTGAVIHGASRRTLSSAYQNTEYTAQATVDVVYGSGVEASVTVTGPAAWAAAGADVITGYRLYANNTPLAALSAGQQLATSASWTTVFTLSSDIPANITVLGLCPVHANTGLHAEEMIVFALSGN